MDCQQQIWPICFPGRAKGQLALLPNISKDNSKPSNLTHDQLGELIFDVMKIKMEDCLRFNFTGARYDTKEIILRPGVDLTPFIQKHDNFYDHSVTTKKQSTNSVKVSFRNVPLNVPDEEILHLCSFYGKKINNKVEY